MVLFWKKKKTIFDLIFTFFSHQGKDTKIPYAHISHVFCSPIDCFCLPPNFAKIVDLSYWFLFGVTPGVDSYLHYFGANNKQQNGEQNLSWNVYYR